MKQILLFIGIFSISFLQGQQKKSKEVSLDSVQKLDEIIINANYIFGNKYVAKYRTGSAYFLSPKELQKFNFTDVNRALRSVPGVTIYDEEGFGLRPNISLRGTSPERSAKITVMEDGILIAPAPYSASSAYYFPNIARMQAIEVLKGSSQVQFGPFTTGGAINMISTEIPSEFSGLVRASYGSFNSNQLYAKVGDTEGNFGYMVEFLNFGSDGFKNLPSGKDTGFNRNDLVVKLATALFPNSSVKQNLEFKFQYSDETGNETYLGLSESDFASNPFYRYPSSNNDLMTTEHTQYVLTHKVDFSSNFRITTNLYRNNFARNWYKLNDITLNNTTVGLANILSNPANYSDYYDVVNGTVNSPLDAVAIKANNRKYYSQGIQTKLDYHWNSGDVFHDIEVGMRYHYDEEDRYQWVDRYGISNTGELSLSSQGIPGTDANRISSANAFASFVTYKIKWNKWTFTPGLRYENISLQREDFGSNDPNRTGANLAMRENHVDVFIPGIGSNYRFSENFSLFGGIHKGFSPPGNQNGEKPEKSINYELGTRFTLGKLKGEFVGFFNDYSNLLGSDLTATGGTGSLDQFNAGEVNVSGLEVLLNYNFTDEDATLSLPISFGYTFTNTEFQNSFGSAVGIWGPVTAGDELPYIPKHQFNTTFSLEHKKFEINVNARFNGEFRTLAGTGAIPQDELVASNFIVDLSGKYYINDKLNATVNVINLFDETYAVSRVPAGLRPGHPFGAFAGLEFRF